ncbi:MAG: hypothetical protein LUE25_07855 [Clostridiales bacterium]|nr:hypothetical protein [Clostridiales bacterium]
MNEKDDFWEEKDRKDFESDEEYEEYLRAKEKLLVDMFSFFMAPKEHVDVLNLPEYEKAMKATRRMVEIVKEAGGGEAPEVDVNWGTLIKTSLGVSITTPYIVGFDKEQLEEIRGLMPESYSVELVPRTDAKMDIVLGFYNIKQMYAKRDEKT